MNQHPKWPLFFASVMAFAAIPPLFGAGAKCESLSGLKLPNTTITLAKLVAPGTFQASGRPLRNLPAFCRVAGVIKPSADSDIKFEVWMPASGWNGKFDGVGNGGFAGAIQYNGLAAAIGAGFAAASTDTGHTGASDTDARWALGHPEKVIDFGYRAIHEMTVEGKAIVARYYGARPERSYFASCSTGGRQALMEAQRFPSDYNGVLSGDPANFYTHQAFFNAWVAQGTLDDPASYIPASKLPAISAAVLAACGVEDGVKSGFVNDPRQCHFDPATLECKGADSNRCLTRPQVTALEKLYAGPRDSKGRSIFPGYEPGGELGPHGWAAWVTGTKPRTSLKYRFGTGFFADMVFDNPAWDFRSLNYDSDVRLADKKLASVLNATNPNLSSFKARGGKLIMFHGWSDAAIPPRNSVNYHQSVVTAMGERETASFMRLYMVPGMHHCGGGPGPNSFGQSVAGAKLDSEHSVFSALERWVEKGKAPGELIATKYATGAQPESGVVMTRPICPYPERAKYQGTGDANDATNFVCARPAGK